MKDVFISLLVLHVIADFYLQTETMAKEKKKDVKWVLIHSGIYFLVMIAGGLLFLTGINWYYFVLIGVSHCVIDLLKFWYTKKKHNEFKVFLLDQVAHLLVIVMASYVSLKLGKAELFSKEIITLFSECGFSEKLIVEWGVKFLLIHKPANILISFILKKYKPKSEKQEFVKEKNAGRMIGTLERILIVFFVSIQQYSAVGLILTAKSITRYNKIAEEPEFAEYYLLGTLLSTICAVGVAVVI